MPKVSELPRNMAHNGPNWVDPGTAETGSQGRLAGGLGFEPRLAESESAVLPLDDPPSRRRRAWRWGDVLHARPPACPDGADPATPAAPTASPHPAPVSPERGFAVTIHGRGRRRGAAMEQLRAEIDGQPHR